MIGFVDDHRAAYGGEPICRVLPIAPSTYHAQVAQRADPSRRSARARRDNEAAPSKAHSLDLCALLEVPPPHSDQTGATYAFETGFRKAAGGGAGRRQALRRRTATRPMKPTPSRTTDAGSGTAVSSTLADQFAGLKPSRF
jgi:hypothetical protein